MPYVVMVTHVDEQQLVRHVVDCSSELRRPGDLCDELLTVVRQIAVAVAPTVKPTFPLAMHCFSHPSRSGVAEDLLSTSFLGRVLARVEISTGPNC